MYAEGMGVVHGYVREYGSPVVVQECLEVFNLGISAGDLFQNGTARMLTAYLRLRVQLVRLKCAVKDAFTG